MIDNKSVDGIAVTGIAGRFPGAENTSDFWHNLVNGVDSISFFTEQELIESDVKSNIFQQDNYVKAKGIIKDIEYFDYSFFGYSPKEAAYIDPQQRIFLECAWHALEDAGFDPYSYQGITGIFCGTGFNNYLQQNITDFKNPLSSSRSYSTYIGNEKDMLATRVAYKLNLTGPCLTIQTACSTSLVAVHMACQSLLCYESDINLAGGVSIHLPSKSGYVCSENFIGSNNGQTRTFDAKASGTVISQGAGIVVLKRLEDAINDNDHIYAVIKSSAINNDGAAKAGYTAPGITGQRNLIETCLELAEFPADTVSYIEAHGTGTPVGDPIEIAALTQAFQKQTSKKQYCAIGSVKTNIGHTDCASGVTGLIKTCLALKNKKIPASLHFETANPHIDFENSPFYINTQLSDWKDSGCPRRAGVSSFGIGGTNAHVMLEEHPQINKNSSNDVYHLITLSAKSSTALKKKCEDMCFFLEKNPELSLEDIAYTLNTGRKVFEYRLFIISKNIKEIIKDLKADFKNHKPNISGKKEKNKKYSELFKLGSEWLNGDNIDWESFYQNSPAKKTSLPLYPFEKKYCWLKHSKTENIENKSQEENWCYLPGWAEASPLIPDHKTLKKNWLIFTDDNSSHGQTLISRLKDKYQVIVVTRGSSFQQKDSRHFQISQKKQSDTRRLLKILAESDLLPSQIIYLWSTRENKSEESFEKTYQSDCYNSFFSVIFLIQALSKYKSPLKIIFVTNQLFSVFNEPVLHPEAAMINGPNRVIPKEYAFIKCRHIDFMFSTTNEKETADNILAEFEFENSSNIIAYRNSKRYIPQYKKMSPALQDKSMLKNNGVYIITGGLGGLGLVLAKHIAENTNCPQIILINRSSLASQKKFRETAESIEEIESCGATVKVYECDITNRQETQELFKHITAEFKQINGLVHTAGNPGGKLILNTSIKNSQGVLDPKIKGTLILFDILKNIGLDFFILYSSLTSLINTIGQADYCAANSFLDAFANSTALAKIRYSTAVNWDAWKECGMAKDYLDSSRINSSENQKNISHPLLTDQTSISEKNISVSNILSPEKSWVLDEHRIENIPLMPGTGFLDMIIRAAKKDDLVLELEETVFSSPLFIKEKEEKETALIIQKEKDHYKFKLYSKSIINQKTGYLNHVSGKIKYIVPDRSINTINISSIKKNCRKIDFNQDFLAVNHSAAIIFGPRWLSLKSVYINEKEIMAEIHLPEKYLIDFEKYDFHPALMDIATGYIRFFLSYIDIEGLDQDLKKELYLPLFYKKIRFFKKITSDIYSYSKLTNLSLKTKDQISVDMVIINDRGELLAEIEGFTITKIKKKKHNIADIPLSLYSFDTPLQLDKTREQTKSDLTFDLVNNGLTNKEGSRILTRLFHSDLPRQVIISKSKLTNDFSTENSDTKKSTVSIDNELTYQKIEETIAGFFKEILGIKDVNSNSCFYESGGDSLSLINLSENIQSRFQVTIPLNEIVSSTRVHEIARITQQKISSAITKENSKENIIKSSASTTKKSLPLQINTWKRPSLIVELHKGDTYSPPLFCIHPAGGAVHSFFDLAKQLNDLTLYAIQARGLMDNSPPDKTIEEMAERYISSIQEIQPQGPYFLCGLSMGGTIAFEIARQLQSKNHKTAMLALIDSPGFKKETISPEEFKKIDKDFILNYLKSLSYETYESILNLKNKEHDSSHPSRLTKFINLWKTHNTALLNYRPVPYSGEIIYFRAQERDRLTGSHPEYDWIELALNIDIQHVPGNHITLVLNPSVNHIAKKIKKRYDTIAGTN
ncbi:MAG: SDR family NAD(P)-dependent oxidoreductase [bacterium]|nr:SDR family NAD(P)-dependent oxidoreductase [bacterium]